MSTHSTYFCGEIKSIFVSILLLPRGLGQVVQSIVSLTNLLKVISLTVLADSIYSFLIFFAEKMWVSHFFSKKFQHICISLNVNFNESLTNDIVSFEQLGPGYTIIPQTFLSVSERI